MKSGGNASRGEEDAAGGRSGKQAPHCRRREHGATTTVYVVHPTEFRTVVQQLTGAASPPPPLSVSMSTHQHVAGGGVGNGGAGAGTTRTNAVAHVHQHQHGGGEQSGSGSGTGTGTGQTLGQMHQDLQAWANADDC